MPLQELYQTTQGLVLSLIFHRHVNIKGGFCVHSQFRPEINEYGDEKWSDVKEHTWLHNCCRISVSVLVGFPHTWRIQVVFFLTDHYMTDMVAYQDYTLYPTASIEHGHVHATSFSCYLIYIQSVVSVNISQWNVLKDNLLFWHLFCLVVMKSTVHIFIFVLNQW